MQEGQAEGVQSTGGWRSFIKGWPYILWIYLSVGVRFWLWRLQFRHRDRLESINNHMKRTLLIIRHGQTTWNVEHRLPGQLPGVVLTDTGHEQAARLADALSVLPISAVISSPLERARETAEYIAKVRNLPIQFEPDLMDTNVGPWAGQTIAHLSKNDPAWKAYVKDPSTAPVGVETFPQVYARVVAAIERWLKNDGVGNYIAFVAHADVVKLLVAHYTGLEPRRAGSLFIDNASVSLVEIEEDSRTRVVAIGWSPRPGWLTPPVSKAPQSEEQAQEVGEQKA
jgi:broad specificity phosphatase PhoE